MSVRGPHSLEIPHCHQPVAVHTHTHTCQRNCLAWLINLHTAHLSLNFVNMAGNGQFLCSRVFDNTA